MEISEDEILELAADLRWLLFLPLAVWGFDHEPDYETFSNYGVAMLHALMLLMPASGRGDPILLRDDSPMPKLRGTTRVGFGTGSEPGEIS